MSVPRPEHEIARQITRLEAKCPPDVMVWNPLNSASGKWEAQGQGWEIIEQSPLRFRDLLEARLSQMGPRP